MPNKKKPEKTSLDEPFWKVPRQINWWIALYLDSLQRAHQCQFIPTFIFPQGSDWNTVHHSKRWQAIPFFPSARPTHCFLLLVKALVWAPANPRQLCQTQGGTSYYSSSMMALGGAVWSSRFLSPLPVLNTHNVMHWLQTSDTLEPILYVDFFPQYARTEM